MNLYSFFGIILVLNPWVFLITFFHFKLTYFRFTMYLDTDDLVTSSIITFIIAIVVFVLSIKAFRWLSPENDVADKGVSSHVWVEKPTYILSVSIIQ